MIEIPKPSEVPSLAMLAKALDEAGHDARVSWCRSLPGSELYRLYALAEAAGPVTADDLVGDDGEIVAHMGKNGVPILTRFQKPMARLGDEVVGYNDNREAIGGPIGRFYRWFLGPGHFVVYDSPEVPGEVWIDYRTLPSRQHPGFPPLADNDHGIPSLVFGNMVDILRRVSQHVFVGDSFKDLSPPTRIGHRIGAILPTAPFALVQVPPEHRR